MPKFEWMTINRALVAISGSAVLAIGAACGTGGSSTPVKVRTQGDKVDAALAKAFGGTYNRLDPANIDLAQRLEGGSAVVEKRERTDKVVSGEPDFDMSIKLIIRRPGKDSDKALAVAYSGPVSAAKLTKLERVESKLMLNSDAQSYVVQAMCSGANCDQVWALVGECDASAPAKVDEKATEAEKAKAKGSSVKKVGALEVTNCPGTVRMLGLAFGPKSRAALLAPVAERKAAKQKVQQTQEAPVYGEYKIIWSGQQKTEIEDSGAKASFAEALASRKSKGPEHDLEALAANQGSAPPPAGPEETEEQKQARLKKEAEEAEARKKAEEEEAAKKNPPPANDEAARKKAEEEAAAKKKAEEEAAAKKKADEDAEARRKADEEEARLKKEEEEAAARKKAEEEAAARKAAAEKK